MVENSLKVKWIRRLGLGLVLSFIVMVCFVTVALAAPGLVTDLIARVSSTTISLSWVPASSSNSTVIRYDTSGFPATPATGTSAYSGSGSYTTIDDLTAGTNYYFSAWGYDGADYSSSPIQLAVTTNPAIDESTVIPYDKPSIPEEAYQDPDSSGWSIDPIDDILAYFADPSDAHGGLGMPTDNLIMFMVGVGITGVGLVSYIKWRNFFSSWVIVLILCCFASVIGVMQWIVVGFLILVGAGVAVVTNALQ
jgi:hypothetical protein